MSYSFKDDVAGRLPAGHSLIRIYSTGETESNIETIAGSVKHTFNMAKVDISPWFFKVPTISLKANATYNDLYAALSDVYSMGLAEGVDYYNSSPVKPTEVRQYVELPFLKDSYGYRGEMRCYYVKDDFGGITGQVERNLTTVDMTEGFARLKIRNYLAGNLFTYSRPIFVEDRLSIGFIDYVSSISYDELGPVGPGLLRNELIRSTVVDVFNDGISDIAILNTDSNELTFLRYLSRPGDLPVIKNNESSDLEIDNSKGLPIGDRDSSSENPGQGKGDINNTNVSEFPNSSTGGNWETDSPVEINII